MDKFLYQLRLYVYIYIYMPPLHCLNHPNWCTNWSKNINGISTFILNKVNGEMISSHQKEKYCTWGSPEQYQKIFGNKILKGSIFAAPHLLADCINFVPMAKPAKPGENKTSVSVQPGGNLSWPPETRFLTKRCSLPETNGWLEMEIPI